MREREDLDRHLSRRGVLKAAGTIAIGAAGFAAASGIGGISLAEAKKISAETWPWPYKKLNPAKTAELAYEEWYRVFCGGAVVSSVFNQLRETVGEPYKSFPIDAFIFLEGGIAGWGTICGTNSGANIVTNLIIGPRTAGSEDGMMMGSEMMQWYSETSMPTFTPKAPKVKTAIPKTVADSPLCHISVGKWMKASNKELNSPERKDRCARLTASMAYHLVELLNDWKDGKYKTQGAMPAKVYNIQSQHNCTDCHGSNIPSPPEGKKA
jgi:hypothetical protein